MSFFDEAIPMLRNLIGDLGATYTYSDSRLEELLCVAAKLVISENLKFDYNYSISISNHTISPDPLNVNDNAFFNFVCLRAACLTDQSTIRTKNAVSGIIAKMGPATLDTSEHLKGYLEILKNGACKAYDQLKMEYSFGNANICKVILGPFVSNDFDPSSLSSGGSGRDRMME